MRVILIFLVTLISVIGTSQKPKSIYFVEIFQLIEKDTIMKTSSLHYDNLSIRNELDSNGQFRTLSIKLGKKDYYVHLDIVSDSLSYMYLYKSKVGSKKERTYHIIYKNGIPLIDGKQKLNAMNGVWKQYNSKGEAEGKVRFKFIEFQKSEIVNSSGKINYIIKLFEDFYL